MTDLEKLLVEATPGPWQLCYYDAGDKSWYDRNGPCPSIEAPEEYDCAIVHWDGFKQEYWSAANGDQRQINANARLIALAPQLASALLSVEERLHRIATARVAYDESALDTLDMVRAIASDALAEIARLTGGRDAG